MLDILRRLQHFGDAAETRVVDDVREGVAADGALADVLVAVDARAEGLLRVVEVKRADVLDADVALHLVDPQLPALRAGLPGAIELVDQPGHGLAMERVVRRGQVDQIRRVRDHRRDIALRRELRAQLWRVRLDRKSTRLNSSHGYIPYA